MKELMMQLQLYQGTKWFTGSKLSALICDTNNLSCANWDTLKD